jgi:ligand-binding SRPBCC domain-containing protein
MPEIRLTTTIEAPVERVFDLSRSITLHTVSMAHTTEKAVAGVTQGLIKQDETVTWQAKHLFKTRTLTTVISSMSPYSRFTDEMIEGDFSMMKHEHIFTFSGKTTTMRDVFVFESPFGLLGKLLNGLFLTKYMKRLLQKRNLVIKEYAETEKWREVFC